MIPDFNLGGTLPPGIHFCTMHEFVTRFGINDHRCRLIRGLERALDELRNAGCGRVFVDGSFVTDKEIPNDYDACWDVQGVRSQELDPVFLDFTNGRLAQKIKYLGEFFPAQMIEGGSGERFLEFFQIDKRTGDSKGIVVLDLQGLS